MEVKIFNFLSTLFRNKDFISQESLILAGVENIIFFDYFVFNDKDSGTG